MSQHCGATLPKGCVNGLVVPGLCASNKSAIHERCGRSFATLFRVGRMFAQLPRLARTRTTLDNEPALWRNPFKGLCKWSRCPRTAPQTNRKSTSVVEDLSQPFSGLGGCLPSYPG